MSVFQERHTENAVVCAEMVDRWIEKKLARLQERMKEAVRE